LTFQKVKSILNAYSGLKNTVGHAYENLLTREQPLLPGLDVFCADWAICTLLSKMSPNPVNCWALPRLSTSSWCRHWSIGLQSI